MNRLVSEIHEATYLGASQSLSLGCGTKTPRTSQSPLHRGFAKSLAGVLYETPYLTCRGFARTVGAKLQRDFEGFCTHTYVHLVFDPTDMGMLHKFLGLCEIPSI